MDMERFIEVSAEIRVVIDKSLIEQLGISEDEARRFVEARVRSLTHRFSAWLTETITSALMLAKQGEQKQTSRNTESKYDAVLYERNGNIVFEPLVYREAFQRRKFLKIGDRLIPLKLNRLREVTNEEALGVLRGLVMLRGKVYLKLLGYISGRSPILGVVDDAPAKASNP